jgi:hypothetical protein
MAADVLVFEFSELEGDAGGEARVHEALRAAIRREGERLTAPGAQPRRFVVINAVNGPAEATIETHLDIALAPFSSRIRHGFLRAAPSRRDTGSRRWLQRGMQDDMARLLPPPLGELQTLEAIVALAARLPEAERGALFAHHRSPLAAYAERTDTPLALGAPPDAPPGLPVDARRSALPAGGGLFDIWDWDDPAWFELARRHFGGEAAADWFARGEGVWERASMLRLLQLHGLLRPEAGLLVCSRGTDEIAALAAEYASVTVCLLGDLAVEPLRDPDAAWFADVSRAAPSRLTPWSARGSGRFDAVILPRHALFSDERAAGSAWASALLTRFWPLLRPRGKIVFSLSVAVAGEHPSSPMGLAALRQAETIRTGNAAYAMLRPRRLTLSPASLERAQDGVVAGRTIPRTLTRTAGATLAEGVFVLERLPE